MLKRLRLEILLVNILTLVFLIFERALAKDVTFGIDSEGKLSCQKKKVIFVHKTRIECSLKHNKSIKTYELRLLKQFSKECTRQAKCSPKGYLYNRTLSPCEPATGNVTVRYTCIRSFSMCEKSYKPIRSKEGFFLLSVAKAKVYERGGCQHKMKPMLTHEKNNVVLEGRLCRTDSTCESVKEAYMLQIKAQKKIFGICQSSLLPESKVTFTLDKGKGWIVQLTSFPARDKHEDPSNRYLHFSVTKHRSSESQSVTAGKCDELLGTNERLTTDSKIYKDLTSSTKEEQAEESERQWPTSVSAFIVSSVPHKVTKQGLGDTTVTIDRFPSELNNVSKRKTRVHAAAPATAETTDSFADAEDSVTKLYSVKAKAGPAKHMTANLISLSSLREEVLTGDKFSSITSKPSTFPITDTTDVQPGGKSHGPLETHPNGRNDTVTATAGTLARATRSELRDANTARGNDYRGTLSSSHTVPTVIFFGHLLSRPLLVVLGLTGAAFLLCLLAILTACFTFKSRKKALSYPTHDMQTADGPRLVAHPNIYFVPQRLVSRESANSMTESDFDSFDDEVEEAAGNTRQTTRRASRACSTFKDQPRQTLTRRSLRISPDGTKFEVIDTKI